MKKAIRRHQQKVAKVRKLRIYSIHCWRPAAWRGRTTFDAFERQLTYSEWTTTEKPWRPLSRWIMNEPGYWVHEFMIQPMRIRSNQQLKLIEKGRDPDEFQWPDGKKPHIYYW